MLTRTFLSLLELDIRTVMAVLFWGNLSILILIAAYHLSTDPQKSGRLSQYYIVAKFLQMLGYFLLFNRGVLPDPVTIYGANTIAFVGYYFEGKTMLIVLEERSEVIHTLMLCVLVFAVPGFNIGAYYFTDRRMLVLMASLILFSFLALPNIKILFTPGVSQFKRAVSAFYLFCACMMLPRGFFAISYNIELMTHSYIQSLTFLAFTLVLISGLTAYLLVLRENIEKAISHMAATDSLTGVSNRHSFRGVATRAFNRQRMQGETVTILFIDIDHFKMINDTYGHAFGDEVLVKLAKVLESGVRPGDLVCRFGGEEFVVMATGVSPANALRLTRRLMGSIRAATFDDYPSFSFTVSMGVVTEVPGESETLADLIDKADKAMYQAKKAGRDRVVEYHQEMEAQTS
ncbi:MAG: GGDEF domain-containing protein [Desulfovibrio sp.]|jgi:diguanylate cyclase (GGDEF)-like protein|nr:GGDEF domain-containing protein [Desulfovibrio sp.]